MNKFLINSGQWLPSATPKFRDIAIIDSQSKTKISENHIKYSFVSNSSSLSSIFIHPRGDAKLIAWSLVADVPEHFNNTYFVSVANGIDVEPFAFDVTLEIFGNLDEPALDITLVSMRYDGKADYTADFKNLLKRVPDWAYAVDCIAAVTSYVF